jgi:Thioredoxin like C-terminal domain
MITDSVAIDKGSNNSSLSPEAYLGYGRSKGFIGDVVYDKDSSYTLPTTFIKTDEWALEGRWAINDENITSSTGGKLVKKINAKKVYLVLGGNAKVKATLDGKEVANFQIKDNELYTIFDGQEFVNDGLLEIQFDGQVTANAFTFG